MVRRAAVALSLVFLAQGVAIAVEPDAIVGSWDVKLKANFSTCKAVSVDDIQAFQLVLRFESGLVKAETVGGGNSPDSYKGKLQGDALTLSAEQSSVELMGKTRVHEATIEASVSGKTMTGRRVVGNVGPCVIIYDLTAKKL